MRLPAGRSLPFLVTCLLAFAGCTNGGGDGDDGGDADVPVLTATASTGVIRALVVDEAIRPLSGALVAVQGAANKTTDQDGFAGFEDLEPGTYVVEAHLFGYKAATQNVEVVAGVDAPPIAKFQLLRQVGDLPFYEQREFEGFLQCAAGAVGASGNVCFIADYYPCFVLRTAGQPCPGNATSDHSFFSVPFFLDYGRAPNWTQVELVWDSTQAVSDELQLRVDIDEGETPIDYARSARGTSPVMVSINGTQALEWGLGINRSMQLEVFTSSSATGDPVGLAANQQIRYFVHAFYGYEPPEGWRFSNDGTVPEPPY